MKYVPVPFESYGGIVFEGDLCVLLFGIFIGGFIMTLLISKIFARSKSIESKHFDKMNFVRFVSKDGKKTYFLNTSDGNLFEIMRTLLIIIFSPSFLKKHYVVKNEKRAKVLIRMLTLCFIIVSFLSLISLFTIKYPCEQPSKAQHRVYNPYHKK